jgi:ankyrin repeat protein
VTVTAEWEAAARAGNRAELEALLQAGADPNARDRYGQTALMLAAHAGHGEAVRALIAAGADLDVSAKFGLTATMLAVVQGHGAVARALAEAGADLHATGSGAPGFAGKTAAVLARDLKQEALALALDPEDRRRPAD